jgi:glycosyltransferase involved in cell wall biosynthesis
MKCKRIVQVVQHLTPGGIETMALDLQRLATPDFEVHVVSLEKSAQAAIELWPKLGEIADRLHFLDKPPGLSPATLYRLVQLLNRLRPAAVHTHHIGPLLYAGLAARCTGVPVVVHTEHDAWHLHSVRRRCVQRLVMNVVRPRLVAVANVVADRLRAALPGVEPMVIRNGVDVAVFQPGDARAARASFGLPQDVPLVGCAARLQPVKGHKTLLDALKQVNPDVHLALAGNGASEKELRERVEDLGLGHRVHFLGLVDDMPSFYRALDVCCLPSYAEGLPLSLLEAQACGVSTVVSDVGGCKEALCPTTGTLVMPGNSSALAGALGTSLKKSAHKSPRDYVLNKGDIHDMVRGYIRLAYGLGLA